MSSNHEAKSIPSSTNEFTGSLFKGVFDFAGLFPPAKLSMSDAVAHYERHRQSAFAWMLGRFVVPASRLQELIEQLKRLGSEEAWELSVLSQDWLNEGGDVTAYAESHSRWITIGSVEQRWSDRLPIGGQEIFVETSIGDALDEQVEAIKRAGCLGKVRMGGLEAAAFPSPEDVLTYLRSSVAAGLHFKATAGLHHPFPVNGPTSNDDDAPMANMHGFVNMLLATALMSRIECDDGSVLAVLESDSSAFGLRCDGIQFRDDLISVDELQSARRSFRSIGSCSFDEPVSDLCQAGWLTSMQSCGDSDGAKCDNGPQ